MFETDYQFYPTARPLIDKMLDKVDFNTVKSILEPSAGVGGIAEVIKERAEAKSSYYKKINYDIDTIEIDKNLQHILRGKNMRVVHDDFLTYNTFKKYDLVIANPPFLNGDKHLLKMLEMQQNGGQIVCILNAETLKNTYSNTRKDLLNRLIELNADIEYIENAFVESDRSTNVEIALIYINIPKSEYNSTLLNHLRQEEQYKQKTVNNSNHLINSDFIQGIVERYNFEVKAGLKLIAEYQALTPFMISTFEDNYTKTPILELGLKYKDDSNTIENGYIRQLRSKYWKALFESKDFMALFTSNLRQEYYEKISELRDYDFSLFNIYSIRIELSKELTKGVEDTILNLFEEFSNKHHYYDETSKNIHLYNGWKTNQAHKINKKIITVLNGYNWSGTLDFRYKFRDKLMDIEKVFNYLDGGLTEHIDITERLQQAQDKGQSKKIDLKYFYIDVYKKGTTHITFKDMNLLHKFNLFGSMKKGWLPPTYGKQSYKHMNQEEKAVIDEFEGEKSYNKVMNNTDYYITDTSSLLQLTS